MRLIFLFLILGLSLTGKERKPIPAKVTPEEWIFIEKLIKYEKHYDAFLRDYLACVKDKNIPIDGDNCKGPHLGKWNVKEFKKAKEAAKKLYNLKEK